MTDWVMALISLTWKMGDICGLSGAGLLNETRATPDADDREKGTWIGLTPITNGGDFKKGRHMFHLRHRAQGTPTLPTTELMTLRQFIEANFTALQHAAELLSGRRGKKVVTTILEGLQNASTVNRRTCHAVRELLGILTLEHVHDDTRVEAMLFAQIDLADPVVDEICLLTDGLRDVLEPLVAYQPEIRDHLLFAA